ncbi:putative short-chain alcohol dehydrogenase [Pseudomonas mandelii JR-1]|uniref:Putative short-chain alcohol dehydrogenase n=1 Tax=Pseudomonas mandelii JR-1 TaxID=1147786 RepID=A0A024E4E3_9PSED|nr:oxidoreductase [Pseudomonas mandelii]AHZ67774.1 putative short-chain alcohol dehydrogenase [Pseudomonas mandelii JR-1]
MTTSHTFKRVWLITGASRGIGARIAAAALANGDAVVATARDASSVTQRFGTQPALLAVSLDVTNEAQGIAVAKAAVEHFGRIDVLVNNAGFGLLGAVEEASADEVRRVYETNVFGLLNITRAVLPYMRAARSGHVINLSSVGGYASGPGFGVYCSTKFAVEGLSEALHAELAPVGVKVTVVEPGYFRTEFLEGNSLVESPSTIADYDSTAGEVRKIAKAVTLNQPGDPDKLAQAMITLVEAKKAPLRLPLGSDCVAAIEAKNAFVADELQTWREVSVSTDY